MKTNYHKANQSTSLSNPYLNNNFIPRSGQVSEGNNSTQREYAWQVASNLLVSFRYAWAGVRYAFVSQRNFRIHTLITLVAISWGLFLRVDALEMAIVTLTCALVMVLELINTALESVVDLTVGQSYHDLAKIAKDCAAGAVLIASIAALLVAAFIFIPHLLV
ncbi:MAG: diacylglycerol kinase family protein [Microcystis sp.]|jgi:diacylglycerol kinase (ATP)|uniref:Diacylglycerol kinase n=1 Tax=Microcystis aeruginosa PCC 9701 TaxID=721123 RepID=I4ILP0_MICAE|nr:MULTISPECIES: diacylglycerol kinase family protein [Microcystis]MCA2818652.1 diacylglycerol kinase family protein [Microcystis sp. M085S1]MCA2855517.1 diacylglycerol kinase family protein [Microcystis sp. M065S1]MCZ8057449.1 diacylglycerol kinase family protein [Microcystis sp. LE19-12.2C]MDJ0548669.1 diacylglycerol kinase family protein [Microcystis sp. M49637_WE12]TRT94678.1 MAG: diacylglycerol kinase family protein [Microcystis flos-aquae Ma_QC_C_20070823_S18D]TRV37160.1 MAG: diacylglyc